MTRRLPQRSASTPPARMNATKPRKLTVKITPDSAMLSANESAIAGSSGLVIVSATAKIAITA